MNGMERFIGDVYDRKNFEYTVVAKVPHATNENVYVYLIQQREYGTDEYSYYVEEY